MEEALINFPKQFLWKPEIKNPQRLGGKFSKFIVCGMGGSALAADLLRITNTDTEIKVWRDYGLPREALVEKNGAGILVTASSYSGNTEETIDAYLKAKKHDLPVAVISTGGKLLELAIQQQSPYIQLPNTGIQPRTATGYSIKALLKLMGDEGGLEESGNLAENLSVKLAGQKGEDLSRRFRGKVPIIYSSNRNLPIAYIWKIKFNETGKIPAFANHFPELNHNEMTGFDGKWSGGDLLSFVFLEDEFDDPRIVKRMEATKKLYEDRKLEVVTVKLEGEGFFHRIFQNLLIADWAALYLAKFYEVDPENVPMVEEFKKLIK